MPVVPEFPSAVRRLVAGLLSAGVLVVAIDHAVAQPLTDLPGDVSLPVEMSVGHLLVSEVMTGGAGASDEFIELYNPTAETLPLEGLEVVYVTASGATVTRKAGWSAGTAGMPAGAHLLIANSAGIFAGLADASFANGLAATGGSVALRVQNAATPIDAVGWGNAASSWLETRPAPAPAAGSSLERLPGGDAGSSQDTDDNLVDFAIQPIPDPQNSGSAPIETGSRTPQPTAIATATATATVTATPEVTATPPLEPTAAPTATPTITATPAPTAAPTPTPETGPTAIADARALPDGSVVTIEGVSLTASDFNDGGGYLIDATGGIAVLLADGSFGRGHLMRVTGTLDDRYSQRTIRSSAAAIADLGLAAEPLPVDAQTGSLDEGFEGELVEVTGQITSSATTLSTGIAWDVDDGSGPTRILVGTTSGVDTTGWGRGVGLTVVGVVGQRDSSGSGISGYRLQPRDASDVVAVEPASSPTPSPAPTATPSATSSASPTPSPTPLPGAPLVTIGEARTATSGARLRIRGVVTAQSGLIEAGSAIVQDATGAILIRIGGDAGNLVQGELVELEGTRSTKAGMLSLRVTTTPLRLGRQADPEPLRRATGAFGEAEEARLVIARGVVSTAVSRPRGGAVSFAIDDGTGQIRVTISSRTGIGTASVTRGTWLELRGVLAQQTTTKAPLEGYRLWPRSGADLKLIAAPVATGGGTQSSGAAGTTSGGSGMSGALEETFEGDAVRTAAVPPKLARAVATHRPTAILTSDPTPAPLADAAPRAAGVVVAGIGVGALALLGIWFVRRRWPPPEATSADETGEHGGAFPESIAPHLSLVPVEKGGARKERRILPPT